MVVLCGVLNVFEFFFYLLYHIYFIITLHIEYYFSEAIFKQPEGRAPTSSSGKMAKYDLATHTVRVKRTGTLAEVMALWDLQGKCMSFMSSI